MNCKIKNIHFLIIAIRKVGVVRYLHAPYTVNHLISSIVGIVKDNNKRNLVPTSATSFNGKKL